MSHVQVAEVWSVLRKRTDIASLLREAVGRSVLGGAFETPSGFSVLTGQAALWQLLLFLKVCLDLQRIYLQPPQPTERYLLHPSTLVLVLLHVLRVKDRLAADTDTGRRQLERLIVQCLQSGCRALQILKEKQLWHPLEEDIKIVNKLKDAIRTSFPDVQVSYFHGFIIGQLCIRGLNGIASNNPATDQWCEHGERIGTVNLPDISIGLPVDSSVIGQAEEAVKCLTTDCQGRFRSYWILYDIWWAVMAWSLEVAMRKNKEPGLSKPLTERAAALLTTLSKFEDHPDLVYKIGTLAAEVYPVCTGTACGCFHNNGKSRDLHVFFVGLEEQYRDAPDLEQHFSAIHEFLEDRKSTIIDSGNAVTEISESLHRLVKDWVAPPTTNQYKDVCYVLNCPQLHPVSFELLRSKLPSFELQVMKRCTNSPKSGQELIELNISCPRCFSEAQGGRRNNDVRVTSARLIAPIHNISSLLENYRRLADEATKKASTWTQEDLSSLSESETGNAESPATLSRPPTVNNSSEQIDKRISSSIPPTMPPTSDHVSGSVPEKTSNSQSRKFFGGFPFQSTKPSTSSSSLPSPNHTMSADAKYALVWTTSALLIYDRISAEIMRRSIKGLRHAAAGSKILALHMKENESRNIVLCSLEDAEGLNVSLAVPEFDGRITAIAVSKDDTKVAVAHYKTNESVGILIFESDKDWKCRMFTWQEKQGPDDDGPLITCSLDGHILAVAWRAKVKQRSVVKLAVVQGANPTGPQELLMPEGDPSWMDCGLSSLAVHGLSGQIFIGAATGKTYPYFVKYSLNEKPVKLSASLMGSSCRIQCAVANSVEAPRFAFVDCESKLYFAKPNGQNHSGQWNATHLKIKPLEERGQRNNIRNNMERVSISYSGSSTTCLFWLAKVKNTLYGHVVAIEDDKGQEHKYRRFQIEPLQT